MPRKRQKLLNGDAPASPPPRDALDVLPLELWHIIIREYLPAEQYTVTYTRAPLIPIRSTEFRFKAARLRCVCRAFAQIVDRIAIHDLGSKTAPRPKNTLPYTKVAFETSSLLTLTHVLSYPSFQHVTTIHNVDPEYMVQTQYCVNWKRLRHIQFTHYGEHHPDDLISALDLLDFDELRSLSVYSPWWDRVIERCDIGRFKKLEKLELYTMYTYGNEPNDWAIACIARQSRQWASTIRDFTLQRHTTSVNLHNATDHRSAWPREFCERLQRLNLTHDTGFPLEYCSSSLRDLTLTSSLSYKWLLTEIALPRLHSLCICAAFECKNSDIGAFAPNLVSLSITYTHCIQAHFPTLPQHVASIARLTKLERLVLDVPTCDMPPFTDKCKIRSLRLNNNEGSNGQPLPLALLPKSIEELDISALRLALLDVPCIDFQHLTCLTRLVVRFAYTLICSKCDQIKIPDSLRVIELFTDNCTNDFSGEFPRIVQATRQHVPDITFIARCEEKKLPARSRWAKTRIDAPPVLVRNPIWEPDYVMCIEPQ